MKFQYEIKETGDVDDAIENFTSERDPQPSEKVMINVEEDGSVAIAGNKEGWLYLAKICIEMAYCSEKDPHYHTHRKWDLSQSMRNGEEKVNMPRLKKDSEHASKAAF